MPGGTSRFRPVSWNNEKNLSEIEDMLIALSITWKKRIILKKQGVGGILVYRICHQLLPGRRALSRFVVLQDGKNPFLNFVERERASDTFYLLLRIAKVVS